MTTEQELVKIFKIVVKAVAEDMYDLLMDLMDKIVYDAGDPQRYMTGARFGADGGTLRGSFFITEPEQIGRMIEAKIYHDPDSLQERDDDNIYDFVHGSNYWTPHDFRPYLMTTLIKGLGGSFFGDGWWTEARDFWTPFEEMSKDGTMDALFRKHFAKFGITYI